MMGMVVASIVGLLIKAVRKNTDKYHLLDRHVLLLSYIVEEKLGVPTLDQAINQEWQTRHPLTKKDSK
jgi:hypothetical protein